MLGTLFYLHFTSLKGSLMARLRRLKQPKYLFGAIVGVAYIYFFFIRRQWSVGPGPGGRGGPQPVPDDVVPIIMAFGAFALLIVMALSWVLPRARAGLTFSEAEIAFLFPAPISRRTLIHYRLLSSQVGLAFTALILTLFSNRWSFLGGNAATHAFGWWIMLATLNLHFTGSSFAITRLLDRGVTSLRRSIVGVTILLLVLGGLAFWIYSGLRAPDAADLNGRAAIMAYLGSLVTSGPLYWVLTIPRMVLGPFYAADVRGFFVALPAALLILVAHYFWVMRTEVAFEEASLAKAEKRAARVAAMKQGDWRGNPSARRKGRDPFRLAEKGRPEIAFLWKNLLSTAPIFRPHVFFIVAGIITAVALWLLKNPQVAPARYALSGIATAGGVVITLLGPQIVKQDLRGDLLNADILKTYPLTGGQLVLGQLLAPIAMLTGMVWLALLGAALLFPGTHAPWLTPEVRAGLAIGGAVLAPFFLAMQLLVPNTAAIFFPAWAQSVGNRAEHGLDVMGQRIIFTVGQLVIVAVALIPCVVAAAITFFIVQWLTNLYAGIVVAELVVIAILIFEIWLGIKWLGRQFERFDLSAELRP